MKLGVAFSGGGVRSAAQLGIMQVLEENGIKPTIFTGTSGGAIVATLLALGMSPREAFEKFNKTNNVLDVAYWNILKCWLTKQPITGIYSGNKLRMILTDIFNDSRFVNISETGNTLAVVSTDIQNGKQIIFSNRIAIDTEFVNDDNYQFIKSNVMELAFAVSASTRLPAVFVPIALDNMLLVDGGLVNNLPSDIAWSLGADRVISIDLGYAGQTNQIGGLYSILKQSLDVMMERGVDANMDDMDIYMNPNIFDVKVLDIKRSHECFERGYDYGKKNIGRIIASLEEPYHDITLCQP